MIAKIFGAALCAFAAGLLAAPASAQTPSLVLPRDANPPLLPNAEAGSPTPRIAPPQSHPHGRTYSEWSTLWWQWAVEIPVDVNPILDTTGENCAEGQEGHVWFLAGSFGTEPVERECTIPTGTALFFPLINTATFNLPPEPGEEEPTLEELQQEVECIAEAELFLEVDGRELDLLERFFVETEIFEVQLPENNVFGLPGETVLSPNLGAGYYVFLPPLPPGEHTIHWDAVASECEELGVIMQDITYDLNIEPGRGGTKRR